MSGAGILHARNEVLCSQLPFARWEDLHSPLRFCSQCLLREWAADYYATCAEAFAVLGHGESGSLSRNVYSE